MRRNLFTFLFFIVLGLLLACKHTEQPPAPDHPRLTAGVVMRDVTFHSAALNREMEYRVVLPAVIGKTDRFPVVYLLHGGGGGFRDWTNDSDIASYAASGLILVMPEGNSSYYMNAVSRPADRYEDYIVRDLITDVETRFPVATGREHRAIAGVSMGGFGAVVLSMRHPELFSFAAGISPALDVPSRPFAIKRWGQWRDHRAIFGTWKGEAQMAEDPFELVKTVDPVKVPYLFLSCGDREGLLPSNERFATMLKRRGFAFEFHRVSGGHDWNQWNARVPDMMKSPLEHTH
jgi:S-formylglutathione hydrolase FrmB